MGPDATLSQQELEDALEPIEPDWRIHEATAATAGHHAVYRLAVDTPDGERACYLKATPDDAEASVDLEARLLAVLDAHTELPVPTVYGAVDDHEALPAPYALLEAMPGTATPRTALASLPEESLLGVGRAVGRYLADLHRLDATDAFGFLTYVGPALDGGRPRGDPGTIAVADPTDDWRERLHDWTTGTLADLASTRFADVPPAVEPAVRTEISDLDGPFEPVLARTDQALENVLLEDGEPSALLDWEFTLGATPAYDVCSVAWSLAGGPYLFAPDVPDRRDPLGVAVLEGYRDRGPDRVAEQVRANGDCYHLLSVLRSMVFLEDWYRQFDLGGHLDEAAADLRSELSGTH